MSRSLVLRECRETSAIKNIRHYDGQKLKWKLQNVLQFSVYTPHVLRLSARLLFEKYYTQNVHDERKT